MFHARKYGRRRDTWDRRRVLAVELLEEPDEDPDEESDFAPDDGVDVEASDVVLLDSEEEVEPFDEDFASERLSVR